MPANEYSFGERMTIVRSPSTNDRAATSGEIVSLVAIYITSSSATAALGCSRMFRLTCNMKIA